MEPIETYGLQLNWTKLDFQQVCAWHPHILYLHVKATENQSVSKNDKIVWQIYKTLMRMCKIKKGVF